MGVGNDPLTEGEGGVGEDEGEGAVLGGGGADEAELELAGEALEAGDGDGAGEGDVVGEEDAEGGGADRDVAGLLELAVVEGEEAVACDEEEGGGRVVLEAHAAGAFDPGLASGGLAVGGDLEEAGVEGAEAVEVGLDAGEVGLVGGGLGLGEGGQGGEGEGEEGAAVHRGNVARGGGNFKGKGKKDGAAPRAPSVRG